MKYHVNAGGYISYLPGGGTDVNAYVLWPGLYTDTGSSSNKSLAIHPFKVEFPRKIAVATNDTIEESDDELEVITRMEIGSGPPGDIHHDYHTTVAFIEALEGTLSTPISNDLPTRRLAHTPGVAGKWQYYTWKHDQNTVDVVAVRSGAIFEQPSLSTDEFLTIADAGNLSLKFAKANNYGFARLVKQGSTWSIDSNYSIGLTIDTSGPPGAPTNLEITNIDQDTELVDLAWTASPTPGVTYEIERSESPDASYPIWGPWQEIATTSSTSYTDTQILLDLGDTPYFRYRVRAYKAAQRSGYSNVVGAHGTQVNFSKQDAETAEVLQGSLNNTPDSYSLFEGWA